MSGQDSEVTDKPEDMINAINAMQENIIETLEALNSYVRSDPEDKALETTVCRPLESGNTSLQHLLDEGPDEITRFQDTALNLISEIRSRVI